ncbi:MAG: restriction endonuclease subunit S, partial [Bacteroides sp.]|nr:restriction endonuclease subunit S [Bacteroides sp.]
AKRVYVKSKEHGIPFLSSSDILLADVNNVKLASKKYMPGIEEMKLDKDWILISRSGTIGNCAYTNEQHAQKLASEDVIRINPNDILRRGYLYAYLASRYGHSLLTQGMFGGVIQHIEPDFVGSLPIPEMPESFQIEVDRKIKSSANLRSQAAKMLLEAESILKREAGLRDLTPDDYDYFGPKNLNRECSCFSRSIKDFGTITFNAFNNSERIRKTRDLIRCEILPIKDVLIGGDTFSSTGLPSIEVKPGHGIMLINQKDIFDNIVTGKYISSKGANLDSLVEYGEVLIACDGTLGENELFCRAIFANEDLKGSFISSHFLRMKTNEIVPSGYLFAWLNSDYGFRLIRNTQAGTKICHPIPRLFLNIPVPILSKEVMNKIDYIVKSAYTKRHEANNLEKEAIAMVETEIESWSK